MKENSQTLNVLVERQLSLESGIADTLEELNGQMSSLLDNAGIYGPTKEDLDSLSPLVEQLQQRYEKSRKSRESLALSTGHRQPELDTGNEASLETSDGSTLRTVINELPKRESIGFDTKRKRIHRRLREAQQKLTANQVVIFYSTEFHRRYLLGVLQCDVDEANYQADGQAFKLPPEKIIGRNC